MSQKVKSNTIKDLSAVGCEPSFIDRINPAYVKDKLLKIWKKITKGSHGKKEDGQRNKVA